MKRKAMARLTMRRRARQLPRQRNSPSFRTTPSSRLLTLLAFRLTRVAQMCPVLRLPLLLLASFQRQLLRRTTTQTQVLRLHPNPSTLPQPLRLLWPKSLRRHVVFSGRPRHREHLHRFAKTRLPAQQTELVLRTWTQAYRLLNHCLVPTSPQDSFSLGLSSVGEPDIEMGTLREVKRGHTWSAC
ncbi:hypothetical protein HPB50_014979 [Hyalomma asiaticum]|uniref:Uncharacterized protein n=1 Tax=Hyalomma asiaticum TaxID=266040 RepID=A0ACB7SWC9_HYAAI|nr:hypothetical protein HPB50_014979 [Hyalomma asiaticum]